MWHKFVNPSARVGNGPGNNRTSHLLVMPPHLWSWWALLYVPFCVQCGNAATENEIKWTRLQATFVHIQAELGQNKLLRVLRWVRWPCPLDTGFEIQGLEVWGRARYLSVTEAPHNTEFYEWMGSSGFVSRFERNKLFLLRRNIFISFKPRNEPRTLAWKSAVLTTRAPALTRQ